MAKRDELPGLGALLKTARENAGLTQVQAAEVSGVHHVSISKFEAGSKTPTLATLVRLAKAFRVKPADLIPFEIEVVPPEPTSPPAPKKAKKK